MTDNEIVKALEYCSNRENTCEKCVLFEAGDDSCDCANKLRLKAVDLINRQKAESSNLTSDLTSLQNDLTSAKAEVEKLRENNKAIMQTIAGVHTEAVKEFADKVQAEIKDAMESNYKAKEEQVAKCKKYGIPVVPDDSFLMYCDGKNHALSGLDYFIENLVKKLVGDNNG